MQWPAPETLSPFTIIKAMLFHSDKLTEKEIQNIMDDFFTTHPPKNPIWEDQYGIRHYRVNRMPRLAEDVLDVNRRLNSSGLQFISTFAPDREQESGEVIVLLVPLSLYSRMDTLMPLTDLINYASGRTSTLTLKSE